MKSWLFAILFFALTVNAAEDVQVTATVDRNQVGLGDVINLTIAVSAKQTIQIDQPRLGQLDGFDLINTSTGIETRSSFVNGQFITEQSRNFNYMLKTNRQGQLTIPSVSVVVDGTVFKTDPITVSVSGERKAPPQARRAVPDPFQELDDMEELFNQMIQRRLRPHVPPDSGVAVNPNEAFFISAVADKTKAYVGEQIVVSFYLYTRGQIRDIDTLKYPDLKGFWKEDLEMATRLNFEQVVVNGLAWQRALLVKYALFPIKPGKATIDSYKAKCTVLTPSSFGFGRPYQFTKASKPIQIEVLDVPNDSRPANFTGAVGQFRLKAQFEPPTGATNQPVTLRIRVDGLGNAKLIELPKLDLPPSFELYDQKSNAKFLRDSTSFKEFEVLIIPREPGVFDVPPVSIATFDPETKKFADVSSQPLKLTVTGTASAAPLAQNPPSGHGQSASSASGPELPALSLEMGDSIMARTGQPLVTVVLYIAVFGFLAQQSFTRLRRKPKKANLGMILGQRIRRVRDFAKQKEWRRMGVEMTNAVSFILGQISGLGGANQDLEKLLEAAPPSVRNELASDLKDVLAQCEALSFAPENLIGELTKPENVTRLIDKFEKLLFRAIELSEI